MHVPLSPLTSMQLFVDDAFCVMLAHCVNALVEIAGGASFPSQLFKANKLSKSEGTMKVECAYYFGKYAYL